jgi:serine/threonine-protein kinase
MTEELPQALVDALADRYQIERELGRGGMARVFLARDRKHGRLVAIKLLKTEFGAMLGADRFLTEIRVTANLQHPNLLPLFDSGEALGRLYYVMPYVEGETLSTRLDRTSQLPVEEVIRIVTLMASALDYAHAHGVVHRDLKPENVLLQSEQPVIADFGIALAVRNAGGKRVTQSGFSLGTPAYMSPEQAAADQAIDARADQYALAVLAYEMLVGETPHTGPNAQVIIARTVSEPARSLRKVRSGIPAEVDAAILRALSKAPGDRFASCGDFARALKGMPGTASRRGRLVPLVIGAIVIAGAVFAGWRRGRSGVARIDEQDQRAIAILPFRNISQDTAQQYFSAGMTEEITSQLGKVAALRVLGRAATAPYDTARSRLQRMGRELGVGSVVDGSVQLAGNRVRINVALTDVRTGQSLWSERYDREVADLFALQDDVARKVTAALQTKLTDDEAYRLSHPPTTNIEAYQVYLRARTLRPTLRSGLVDQATLLKQAIQLDTAFALAWASLGRNYLFRGNSRDPFIDSGFVAARRAIQLDPALADGYFALGDLLQRQAKLTEAREAYRTALQLSPSHDGAMADLANALSIEGKYDESLDWSLRSRQINPNHPHVPYHVGLALLFLGDDSVTTRYLLAAERRLPLEPRIQGLLAWFELRRGDTAASLGRLRRAVRDHPDDTELPPLLAEAAAMTQAADAEALLKPQVERDPASPSQYSPANLRALYAMTLARRGDSARARRLWAEGIAAAEREIKAGAEGPIAVLQLAAIAGMQGRKQDALDLLERSHKAGFRDAGQLAFDPSFATVRQEPRYRALVATMEQELLAQRQRAAAEHPELFNAR